MHLKKVIITDQKLQCFNCIGFVQGLGKIIGSKENLIIIKINNEDWLLRKNQFRKFEDN